MSTNLPTTGVDLSMSCEKDNIQPLPEKERKLEIRELGAGRRRQDVDIPSA